ncbi:MAG: serine/threonine protein kinase [Acidobacteria bacterium]|nr:serine/threonine protein kinase [Acidobacteriota bacterium]MCI0721371.1 serine/threonine protein kinase [Acidobacteriota bacterium]
MSPIYTRLGKYEIVRKLGRGGMADVYLALDTEKKRQVALKLIEHSSDRDGEDTLEAERRGAMLQARLAGIDSRVAAVHEYDELDGHFYIDMEYVEGEDLSEILRKGALQLSRVVKIAIEICDMLAQAHAFNTVIEGKEFESIVHGDIKPRNVRINAQNQVKVLDFGIAKALSRTRKLTRNEFGSVAYSSPERLESGDVDVHSDLWSVGVLLYEMVTRVQPYRADSTGKLERLIRDRVPPAPLPADCPQALRKIILKILAPAINRRYQSAAQIKADLEAFRDGMETKAELEQDSETTRRTQPIVPADNADDRTRRTTQSPPIARSPEKASLKQQEHDPASARRKTIRRAVQAVLVLLLVWLVSGEIGVWRKAHQLRVSIDAEQTTNLKDAWNQYQQLASRSYLPAGLSDLRRSLKHRFVAAAERVIADYRGDTPRVAERQWEETLLYLSWALELDSTDRTVRAYKRYCEAHIDRINGEARKLTKRLNDALQKFREAAALKHGWPDPHLGLARVYIYDLNDLEKGSAELKQAEEDGYVLGNREKAQMADGFRNRADRICGEMRRLRTLPQEKEHLLRAREDYVEALRLYETIFPYGDSGRNIQQTQARIEKVEERLADLDEGRQ